MNHELVKKKKREKILDPRNTRKKKFRILGVIKTKNFGPTKHPYLKKFWTHEIIPTRKKIGRTKYPGEKISDPRNTQAKKFWSHEKKYELK